MKKVNGLVLAAAMAVAAVMPTACKQQGETGKTRSYDVLVLKPESRELSSVYSATIRGKQDIDIRPKVSGYITEIHVREGAYVTKGKPLFIIDQAPYQAALQTAVANVNIAKAAVEAIRYYNGICVGIASIFAGVDTCEGVPVVSIFNTRELIDYASTDSHDCPLCKAGIRIDALVNAHGISSF